jgi:hypothetical protein
VADNVLVSNPPLVDYTVASDEVAVAGTQPVSQVQWVKLVDGTVNGTTPIAGDANGLRVNPTARAATTAVTSVASSASNVTLLASNTSRVGAAVFNDSTALLFVKLGATASATSFTVKLYQDGYFEVPFGYTGIIDGIWASATGSARVTEVTP